MKTLASFILVFSTLIVIAAFAFARPVDVYNAQATAARDTIKHYSVQLSAQTRDGVTTYKVNGQPATKAEYDKYSGNFEQFKTCTPCYMRTYSIDEKLLNEGDRYTDCCVGYWKKYYPNGNVKEEGHYKPDETGKWNMKKTKKWCSIKHGKWSYYSETGVLDSTVVYRNNVRVQ